MKLIAKGEKISQSELRQMAKKMFGNLVKAVVDVEKGIMAVDADLHADEEAFFLNKESEQKNLWGINLYPEMEGEDFVEFDSMINLRPSQNNRSCNVENLEIQKKILEIVGKLVEK